MTSRVIRRLVALVGPLALLVVVACGWLAFRGVTVVREMDSARAGASSLEGGLRGSLTGKAVIGTVSSTAGTAGTAGTASNEGTLAQRVAAVGRHTAAARNAANDPVWRVAARLPFVGQNFAVVSAAADAADDVVRRALPGLASAAGSIQDARATPLGKGLPLAAVGRLGGSLRTAAEVTAAAQRTVAQSPKKGLLGRVTVARSQLLTQLTDLHQVLQPAADAAAVIGPMLGSTAPRTYFVGFLNPAEARSGGGLLGGFAVVRADHGSVSVHRVGSNTDLPKLQHALKGLPADYVDNWADLGGTSSWSESNLSAHFPYTAQTWAAMYSSATGTRIDGALSLDPAALSVLLRGAPAIDVGGGARVTSGNVVSFIQRDEYALPLTDMQRKAVLRTVAHVAISRLTQQPASALSALLPSLASSAGQGHVRLWSSVASEQAVLARYALSGQVPVTTAPFASVLVNNAASGKLDAYLSVTARYAVRSCTGPRRKVELSVVFHNTAPTSGLPAYVTVRNDGAGRDGGPVPAVGANRSLVGLMLTDGSQVTSAQVDGVELGSTWGGDAGYLTESTERGHPVESAFVAVDPGKSTTLVLAYTEPASTAPPILLGQPMALPQVLRSATSCPAR